MPSERNKNLIEIHIAAVLFGVVGLLVKLISASSVMIGLGRSVCSLVVLTLFVIITKQSLRLNNRKDYFFLCLVGVLQAVQWLCYFESVKASNVAISLISLFTFPVFVSILEPIFFKEKFRITHLFTSLAILGGIILIVPEFSFENNIVIGVLWGIASAVLLAFPFLLHRKYVQTYSGLTITVYKTVVTALLLLPFALAGEFILTNDDMMWLVILGTGFTAIPFLLLIKSMKTLRAQQASAIVSLEVVHGIVFAAIFINEIPTFRTILGGCVILGVTLYLTYEAKK